MRTWLTTHEFGEFIGYVPEVVTRMIRESRLKAGGRPYRIPIAEVKRFGFNVEDAREFLSHKKQVVNA